MADTADEAIERKKLITSLIAEFRSLAANCDQKPVNAVCDIVKRYEDCSSGASVLHLNGNQPSLREHRLNDQLIIAFMKALKLHNLTSSLDLSYNSLSDEGAVVVANLLKDDTSLVEINLTFNDITAQGAEALFLALRMNCKLAYLHLSSNRLGNNAVMKFAATLQVNDTIRFVDLDSTDCEVKCIIALLTVLKTNEHIQGINLGKPLITTQNEEHVQHLYRMLEVNTGLKRLHLSRWNLRDSGAERLFRAMYANRTLLHLDLSSNRIGCDGAAIIAQYLGTNPQLVTLNLQANRIQDDGAAAIAEQLMLKNHALQRLSVQHNELSDHGLCALAQCLRSNTSLRYLLVWGNHFGPAACEAFAQLLDDGASRFSNCGVDGDYGIDVSAYHVDGKPQVGHMQLLNRTGLRNARDTVKV